MTIMPEFRDLIKKKDQGIKKTRLASKKKWCIIVTKYKFKEYYSHQRHYHSYVPFTCKFHWIHVIYVLKTVTSLLHFFEGHWLAQQWNSNIVSQVLNQILWSFLHSKQTKHHARSVLWFTFQKNDTTAAEWWEPQDMCVTDENSSQK